MTDLTKISILSLDRLFEIAAQHHYAKGQTILKEGQTCNFILFVETGYLRTFINKDGKEINTDFTFEGSFTTNLKSLRSGFPSDTTIIAEEPATIYQFNKDALLALYNVSAEIESFGRKLVEQLLIAQEEHTNLFKIYSPTERYQYFRDSQPEMLQRVSLSQLASYLGVARETLSRIRKNKG